MLFFCKILPVELIREIVRLYCKIEFPQDYHSARRLKSAFLGKKSPKMPTMWTSCMSTTSRIRLWPFLESHPKALERCMNERLITTDLHGNVFPRLFVLYLFYSNHVVNKRRFFR